MILDITLMWFLSNINAGYKSVYATFLCACCWNSSRLLNERLMIDFFLLSCWSFFLFNYCWLCIYCFWNLSLFGIRPIRYIYIYESGFKIISISDKIMNILVFFKNIFSLNANTWHIHVLVERTEEFDLGVGGVRTTLVFRSIGVRDTWRNKIYQFLINHVDLFTFLIRRHKVDYVSFQSCLLVFTVVISVYC